MMILKHKCTLRLEVKEPFNFRATLWKPSHFPTGLECHSSKVSWRTFRFGKRVCGARFEMVGPTMHVRAYSNQAWDTPSRNRFEERIRTAFGLSEDLRPFIRLATRHGVLKGTLRTLRGMRMSCPESLFEIAIISLLLQNTTIKRSQQMLSNILREYGRTVSFDGCQLKIFCSPADLLQVSEQELRTVCRLGYRAKYLPRFAEFFASIDDDELRASPSAHVEASLRTIKGVGPYTANVILSHAMRDPSAIALDVWNRRIMARALFDREDATPSRIRRYCEKHFPGNGGLACLYLTEFSYWNRPLVPVSLVSTTRQRK